MKVVKVPIGKVRNWEDNPRTFEPEDLDRLVKQVRKLGPYKPLLGFAEGDGYVVLGGNMRLRAYREIGLEEVEIVLVKVKTEGDKIAVSLSDNDRAGYYEELPLAEMLWEHREAIDLGLFKVDLGAGEGLERVLETLGRPVEPTLAYPMKNPPGSGPVLCPNCGAVVEEAPDGS